MGLGRLAGTSDQYDRSKEDGGTYDGGPFTVSPDGQTLVLSSPKTGRGDLYAVSLHQKSAPKRLTDTPNCDINPVYSPNGKQIVFVRQEFGPRTFGGNRGTGDNPGLFIMNADGSNARPLTLNPSYVVGYSNATFSPNGRFVMVLRASYPPSQLLANLNEWVKIDTATGQTHIIQKPMRTDAVLSPDNRTVYFSARDDRTPGNYQTDLYAAPTAKLNARPGVLGVVCLAPDAGQPSVSPDGKRLVYVSYAGEDRALYLMQTKGRKAQRLWSKPRFFPDSLQWEPSGKSVLFSDGAAGSPKKIVRVFVDTGKTEVVVKSDANGLY